LIQHKQYIDKYGQDMQEIQNWKWPGKARSDEKATAENLGFASRQ
jgi:hypothetical protein